MPAREMHPLCCIALDCHGVGWRSPEQEARPEMPPAAANGGDVSVAGVLYKWTNYGRGWRSRWFCLRNGVISYSKIRRIAPAPEGPATGDVRIIGGASSRLVGGGRRSPEPNGVVRLKVSAFRESKSDDRRFYVFSPTKTLHLRTDSKDDRVAWIEALISARSVHSLRSLSERISLIPNDLSFSTERLRNRMHLEGLSETLIKECEQIMLSEFSDYNKQLKLRFEEHINFFEDVNVEDGTAMRGRRLQLMRDEFSSSAHAKFSEYSTTESSDDVEKQEADELSDEDQPSFYDAMECFTDTSDMNAETECKNRDMFPHIERRNKLPEPHEKEKGVSLWSVIKDSVGKDLTRVCLPVYFNEPLSSLQKCFEDLEYSYLLDEAYQFGKMVVDKGSHVNRDRRRRLFNMINGLPTIYEVVTGTSKKQSKEKTTNNGSKSNKSSSKPSRQSDSHTKTSKMTPLKDEEESEGEDEEDEEEHGNTLCGACGDNYANDEFWICCDLCEKWFHGKCVKITPARAEHIKQYKCPGCSNKRART